MGPGLLGGGRRGLGAEEGGDTAHAADAFRTGGGGEFGGLRAELFAAFGKAYLDELGAAEGGVELLDDGGGEAVVAEADGRIELLGAGTEGGFFGSGHGKEGG